MDNSNGQLTKKNVESTKLDKILNNCILSAGAIFKSKNKPVPIKLTC